MIRIPRPPGLLARVAGAALAAGLAAGAATVGLGLYVSRSLEQGRQRQRVDALVAVAGPDLGTACFLEDRALAERAVAVLMGSPDLRGVVLRTRQGLLAEGLRPGRAGDPAGAEPWVRSVPSPFAREAEVGQLLLDLEPGEVRRRAAADALLAGAGVLGAILVLVPVLVLMLHRQVVQPLASLSRQARRFEAGGGGALGLPRRSSNDLNQLVMAFNAMVRRVAEANWGAPASGPAPTPSVAPAAGTGAGVFLVRQDGALETWSRLVPGLLGTREPKPGTRFPALFGPAAARVEAGLAECAARGQAALVLSLPRPGAETGRWLHLALVRVGPDWIQGAVQDVTEGMAALAESPGAKELNL